MILMKKLEKEINVLLEKEAQMWGQRAKVQWLKDGLGIRCFFIAKLHNEEGKTTSRGCMIMMVNGALSLVEWRGLCWSFIRLFSLPKTRRILMRFWHKYLGL